ncbi:aminoglycoside 6-adenylyltransferase [Chitinophaga pendula]|uniref:aminoglycoside 6-adenylyltransferase n=1 Tax=Chitinophaga TaxID=79328 RepID=UPI000BB004D4|nr:MULTISPECIES: aminoglycoside 6-adenylyltransferase [Chitinophaga]ASZ12862.1 aminoglycoside adenylyltransferase [Chitinophaga sp. MD30]UCJ09507.1 aminoglycoside 6-adenylyltransferase [Chitinophaga pendula]
MRSETTIRQLILDVAGRDERIRAVLLNGSRANPAIDKDIFQDYDIVFVVTALDGFIADHSWVDIFGERVMMQLPDTMRYVGIEPNYTPISFGYLMQFKDGNRIDLTLFPVDKLKSDFVKDSLTVVWLDKDGMFGDVGLSDDIDYHIRRPEAEAFAETCNEFWWVSMNVVKGLQRHQPTYVKEMLERYLRPMFLQMVSWKIGVEHQFAVSFGKAGKLMQRYLPEALYKDILTTYVGYEPEENWQALLRLADLFKALAHDVGGALGFVINREDEENVMTYLRQQYATFGR